MKPMPLRRQALLFSIEAKVPIVPRRFTTQAKNSVTKRFHRSGGNCPRHTFFPALEVGSDTPGLYWWCCGAGSLHHWMDATQMKTWIKETTAQINRCRSYRFNFHLFLGTSNPILAGGFKYLLFSTLLGEIIQFDEHTFQMGWFNHQLV